MANPPAATSASPTPPPTQSAPDLQTAAKDLRVALENALKNGLADVIGVVHNRLRAGRREKNTNTTRALSVEQWCTILVDGREQLLKDQTWSQRDFMKYLIAQAPAPSGQPAAPSQPTMPSTLNNEKAKEVFTELLKEVKAQQARDLEKLLKMLYERDYGLRDSKNIERFINKIGSETYRYHFWKEGTSMLSTFLKDLNNKHIELLWASIRARRQQDAQEHLQAMLNLLTQEYFTYDFQEGLGLLADAIADAFLAIGVQVTLETSELRLKEIDWSYLERHQGPAAYPDPNRDLPNIERGSWFFYAWWKVKDERTYENLATTKRWPSKAEGEFIIMNTTSRRQHFTDKVRMPTFQPGEVIICGAAQVRFTDLLFKSGIETLFHGIPRRPGLTMWQVVKEWYRLGEVTINKERLSWHWAKYDGQLPMSGQLRAAYPDYKDIMEELSKLTHLVDEKQQMKWTSPGAYKLYDQIFGDLNHALLNESFRNFLLSTEDSKRLVVDVASTLAVIVAHPPKGGQQRSRTDGFLKEISDAVVGTDNEKKVLETLSHENFGAFKEKLSALCTQMNTAFSFANSQSTVSSNVA